MIVSKRNIFNEWNKKTERQFRTLERKKTAVDIMEKKAKHYSDIINEIIGRKKEKETSEISRNSNRLKEAFLRKENKEIVIINH